MTSPKLLGSLGSQLRRLISVKAIGLSGSQQSGCPLGRVVRLCTPVWEATHTLSQVPSEPQAGDLEEVG